jgi:hypothetical protein
MPGPYGLGHAVLPDMPHHTDATRVFDGQVYRLASRPEHPQGERAVWENVMTGEERECRDDDGGHTTAVEA